MRFFRSIAASALVVAAIASSSTARADGLSVAETESLLGGSTIVRPVQVERWGRRYVGGVSYVVVDAGADEVTRLLGDVGAWQRILPKTRAAQVVGFAGEDELVEVTHGTALVQASYTMRVRREARGVRFWIDPARRHDIEDAWGFLRVEPLQGGRAMLTYGVLVDMGPGLLRNLFENRVRDLALSVPDRVRTMLFTRSAAGRRASR